MNKEHKRIIDINLQKGKSAFLWGPRKVGKTYWINKNLNDIILIDLLKTDIFAEYASRPHLLRERYQDTDKLIVIDEVQMIPGILNEVHWLIENKSILFLLTGSSPRKIRQAHANLLGGRAWRYTMTPLCYPEIEDLDIDKAITSGLIPSHYDSETPEQELRSYVADYLKEEIAAWATTHNIPAFAEFLRIAALTNGEILNYTNVARESGVSAKVVKSYFQILEDTLLAFRLQPWRRQNKRKLAETEKFYFFDTGIANYLARRKPAYGSQEYGKSFEHYILMELMSYKAYKDPELPVYFWRTNTGLEVDFILDEMKVAVEVKSSNKVHSHDAKGLNALAEEYKITRKIIVSFEKETKKISNDIECLHWKTFLGELWNGNVI